MGKITRIKIYSNKILSNKKILLVSDIHKQKDSKERHLLLIKKKLGNEFEKLNYIIIPGDIVNDIKDLESTSFRSELREYLIDFTASKKTIISVGNHDRMTLLSNKWTAGNSELIYQTLENMPNIKILKNGENIIDGEIEFSSFAPNIKYYTEQKEGIEVFKKDFFENYNKNLFHPENYNIFLIHEPQSIIKLSKLGRECIQPNTDLVVSGHMHNGLLPNILHPFFKNRGLLSPQFELFPEFAQGTYQIGDTNFIMGGAVNTRVETPIINFLYGYNATVIDLKNPEKTKIR